MRNFNRLSLVLPIATATLVGAAACGANRQPNPVHSPKPSASSSEACGGLAPPKILGKDSAGHTRMQNTGGCVDIVQAGSYITVGKLAPGEKFITLCNEQKPPVWDVETDQIALAGMATVVALDPATISLYAVSDYRTAVPFCPTPPPTPSLPKTA